MEVSIDCLKKWIQEGLEGNKSIFIKLGYTAEEVDYAQAQAIYGLITNAIWDSTQAWLKSKKREEGLQDGKI